ncbi:MAG TPA: O-antigen ligase family protein, partial [Solirubrobacteraceae bacterium]
LVWLGTACALGTILEYRSHVDVFGDLAKLIPGAHVHVPRLRAHVAASARISFGGPAKHGLADATMLDAAVPIAAVFLLRAREVWHRIGWGAALIVLIAGCVATQEKTALILLFVSLAAIVAYNPRRYKRWWPLLIVAVLLIRIASPHSISELIYQFKDIGGSNSTSGRTTDYPAVAPFLNTHLLFGRGFGSYEPHKYRILDDQMLGFLIEIGAVGLIAYTALILTPAAMCVRRGLRGLSLEDDLLAALSTGFLAFFVSNFLYDSFSFRQGPYTFFFLAALVAAAVGRQTGHTPVQRGDIGIRGAEAPPA